MCHVQIMILVKNVILLSFGNQINGVAKASVTLSLITG